MNKLQAAEQFRRVVQIFAAQLTDKQAREVATVYPRWEPGVDYAQGDYLTHREDENGDPLLYKVAQTHTSAEEWAPADTPALYTCISLSDSGWPIWAPPTGAQDAYNIGDIVSHNGTQYQSKIDGNSTEPGTDDRWWSVYQGV